jgi:hypothetical protein
MSLSHWHNKPPIRSKFCGHQNCNGATVAYFDKCTAYFCLICESWKLQEDVAKYIQFYLFLLFSARLSRCESHDFAALRACVEYCSRSHRTLKQVISDGTESSSHSRDHFPDRGASPAQFSLTSSLDAGRMKMMARLTRELEGKTSPSRRR